MLSDEHAPVVEYLNDTSIYSGMTVPIHMQDGACAVVTGFWYAAKPGFIERAGSSLADFSLLANVLNVKLLPTLDDGARRTRAVHLTARERECIRLAADGFSAKQIALQVDRSLPTIVMHLQSAARKLGARNRAQAIARAAHYRLLA